MLAMAMGAPMRQEVRASCLRHPYPCSLRLDDAIADFCCLELITIFGKKMYNTNSKLAVVDDTYHSEY